MKNPTHFLFTQQVPSLFCEHGFLESIWRGRVIHALFITKEGRVCRGIQMNERKGGFRLFWIKEEKAIITC